MYDLKSILNTIIHSNALEALRLFPSACIDMCVTSPPYYGKRDYSESTTTVWAGCIEGCEHEWYKVYKPLQGGKNPEGRPANIGAHRDINNTNFCGKCGAWRGQLGLEQTPSLYIQHLTEIFAEIMRLLKPRGSLYVKRSRRKRQTRRRQG